MRNFLLLTFTLLCGILNAQHFEPIGEWSVKEIISREDALGTEDLIHGLSKATFEFRGDKSLSLSSKIITVSFEKLMRESRNSIWEFDREKSIIIIKNRRDNSTLIKILVNTKDSETMFTFEDINLVLEMENKKLF